MLTKTKDGKECPTMRVYLDPPEMTNREPVDEVHVNKTDCLLIDYENPKLESTLYWLELEGTMEPEETAEYDFSTLVSGTGKVFIDGTLVVDNKQHRDPKTAFSVQAQEENMAECLWKPADHTRS